MKIRRKGWPVCPEASGIPDVFDLVLMDCASGYSLRHQRHRRVKVDHDRCHDRRIGGYHRKEVISTQ